MKCSIGIPAYNEEANIGKLLDVLLTKQKLSKVEISEIIVVSSGSADRTNEIVENISKIYNKVFLIKEDERRGKASAINIFLANAKEEILVLESADTIPDDDCIEKLILPFENSLIGMVGARPVPINDKNSFVGYAINLLWELHHLLALQKPKCGEMIAFRKIFESIPPETVVDEPAIEEIIARKRYKTMYVSESIVYNCGPSSIRELLFRRKNIVAGYLKLSKTTGYKAHTLSKKVILKIFCQKLISMNEPLLWLLGTILIEITARILGWLNYHFSQKNLHIWKIAESTKNLSGFVDYDDRVIL